MGHDARFRGHLIRALAAGDWTNQVDWFVDHSTALSVTVEDALAHVARLISRDWTEKVVKGASRATRRPVSAPSVVAVVGSAAHAPVSPDEPRSTRFVPQDVIEARIDSLMERLGRPMAGKWGWLDDSREFVVAARVVQTHADPELAPSAWHFDVVTAAGELVTDVAPAQFRVDDEARNAS